MKKRGMIAVAAIAFFGGTVGAGRATAAPSEQDTAWMVAAHQSNLAEIAAGQAAQQEATTQAVKDLGAMFIQMHTQLDADLTAAATQLGVTLPTAPTPQQQQELASVSAQQGAAFDTAWIAQQTAAHQQTLQATQTEVQNGSDPTVVQLATAATPVVQQHLTELQALTAAGGAPSRVPTGTGGDLATDDGGNATIVILGLSGILLVLAAGGLLAANRRRPA